VIGGGICFLAAFVLPSLMESLLQQLLIYQGIAGVIAFDSFKTAKTLILFGAAYLPCGFLGGLYTGYKSKEVSSLLLFITSAVGIVSFTLLLFFWGGLGSLTYYNEVLISALIGNLVGVHLGGYTMKRPLKKEEEQAPFSIDLDEETLKE